MELVLRVLGDYATARAASARLLRRTRRFLLSQSDMKARTLSRVRNVTPEPLRS